MTYNKFSDYLKKRFGGRTARISVDAGFSCPNRDGKISEGGCIYCDNKGFSRNSRIPPKPIKLQIEEGISIAERKGFKKYILYFQAFTNTYADVETLKRTYDHIKEYKDFVMLAIGTRPDCVTKETLSLIESYSKDYEVWVEYGMQSVHNKTLTLINRGHQYEDFHDAVSRTREVGGIKICAHIILGLPGETEDDILMTAKELGRLKIEGVKIHPLHVIKGTKLEDMYLQGSIKLLSIDEYVSLVVKSLERVFPDTVIQRLTADCPREYLAGPSWLLDKSLVIRSIEETLLKNNTFQGKMFGK